MGLFETYSGSLHPTHRKSAMDGAPERLFGLMGLQGMDGWGGAGFVGILHFVQDDGPLVDDCVGAMSVRPGKTRTANGELQLTNTKYRGPSLRSG
jgi:hypothetical protein